MNAWKKAVCAALAVAMLLVAGCSSADLSWAYRSGDIQPPIGVYIFYLIDASSKAETEWHETHDAEEEGHEHPPYKEMLAEILPDGRTVEQFMRQTAEQSMYEFITVERKFSEQGLTLSSEETTLASTTAANAWTSDEENYTRLGIAESSLRQVVLNQLKREALFQAGYGPAGDKGVSELEMRNAFQQDYALVDMMSFHTGESDDAAAALKEAGEYRDRLDKGENFYDLMYEYQKKNAAADGEGEAEVERLEDGSRAMIVSESERDYYGDTLTDAMLTTETGKSAVVQEGSFVYLLQRGDILKDPSYLDMYRSQILQSLKGDEFDKELQTWVSAGAPYEANDAALERYQPAKLKIDA